MPGKGGPFFSSFSPFFFLPGGIFTFFFNFVPQKKLHVKKGEFFFQFSPPTFNSGKKKKIFFLLNKFQESPNFLKKKNFNFTFLSFVYWLSSFSNKKKNQIASHLFSRQTLMGKKFSFPGF